MVGKCKNKDCVAPISCHDGHENYELCPNWVKNIPSQEKTVNKINRNKETNVNWDGEPLLMENLSLITSRNSALIIGIVGKANAAKTTFLAMLYTLLLHGKKLEQFDFAGTKTILGWDELHFRLKVLKEKVAFPDPTPFGYLRLLHLALRDRREQLKDVLFPDVSGEVFYAWSQNRNDDNVANARWVYENSNAFILFIDCEDLIERKGLAKSEVIDIAEQLNHNLKNRPVVAVWSKSDKKEAVHLKIRNSLAEELKSVFSNFFEIDVSNFSTKDPDYLVHVNNLKVIDWLLDKIITPFNHSLVISKNYEDIFLNYKGR